MALFNKIFFLPNRKKSFSTNHQPYISHFPFEGGQVRILLYKECDRGRRLLFDSGAIQQTTPKENQDEKISCSKLNGTRFKDNCHSSKPSKAFEISNGFGYKHSRPNSSDISNIGEMVFGALAMSFRGTALKVHWLQAPSRILCSQVFLSPVPSHGFAQQNPMSGTLTSESSIDNTSISSLSMPFSVCVNENLNLIGERVLTHPLDVPMVDLSSTDNGRIYSTYSIGDSGYCGTDPWTASSSSYCQYSTRSSLGSVFSDQDSLRKLSVDSSSQFGDNPSSSSSKASDGNLQRRISRNISTSFENRNSSSDFIGYISDHYQTATNGGSEGCVTRYRRYSDVNATHSNPEMIRRRGTNGETALNLTTHTRHGGKRPKLGLAVCITMSSQFEKEMEQFCSEHIALLESMLCRLRASAEDAYVNRKNFLQIMFVAWRDTVRWISDLFTAPRLPCPVWMTLSSAGYANSRNLAESFMQELCLLLSSADTKDTNFFISTMLTAVLTHHLGWVSTVAAFNSKSKSQTTEIINEQKARLIEISRKHPYNALWAQMGDLYGAVGNPPKISRTVIYGVEQRSIEKVLNVLTYFIRCGEVRRVPKSEVFDKNLIDDALSEHGIAEKKKEIPNAKSGLKRTQTCNRNLSEVDSEDVTDMAESLKKHVMNDIPNVLAYRDSRFVQQELRIGNYLMDTGIEMNSKQKFELKNYQLKEKIHVTVTTPDNIEIPVVCSTVSAVIGNESPVVEEAIEIKPLESSKTVVKKNSFTKLFGKIESVKEGLSWEDLDSMQDKEFLTCEEIKGKKKIKFLKRSASLFTKPDKFQNDFNHFTKEDEKCQTSLSDLITANNVGQKSERFTWGIERIKEAVSAEEEQHFELSKKIVEREQNLRPPNNVVFVLGDNETLVNIKKSTDNLHQTGDIIPSPSNSQNSALPKCTCKQHKKHSGVIFNFQQYPQIATNYMKNKNLDLSNYDFLEKSSKLDGIFGEPTTSTFPTGTITSTETPSTTEQECEYCSRRVGRMLQTPSNATELEFETNDNYSTGSISLATIPESSDDAAITESGYSGSGSNTTNKIGTIVEDKKLIPKTMSNGVKSIPILNVERDKNDVDFFRIPIPLTEDGSEKDSDVHIKSGFIPSLFTGVSDHYISDMVLQGTLAAPHTWELDLKQELSLAAHCSSLVAAPTENVAVIADLDKWDVKVVSSQTSSLPYGGSGASRPIGMSQLVSTMLETVHAMRNSGISAYECMSYLESKLQEMYLQSEALAAFLLATEFCSMSTITSALNLSANDVPLLLSVASIHSPQVTKKYGVSFR